MYQKIVRKLGFSNLITLPRGIVKNLRIGTGTILNIEEKDGKIIMTPIANQVLTPIIHNGEEDLQ